ncbi:MAG: NAD(P)-dependent dehydrogenase, short-chain alcohol dehydrogenase family [Chloroflexi bacterium]|jgi:NAD(P)-dependent dehydrogenase (short-subunit alcohol dehydrogenase family)|nr:MAG: NAD(P)-dependent dehydrogenase, short-chain alcohol dehydrogenase family [Chloroflexota bacterium]
MLLEDKVAIVTGSAQGIGRIYALRLAEEGAKVVVTDVDDPEPVATEIAENGGEALAVRSDVSDFDSVKNLVARTIDRFGRVDILVNNAAMFGKIPPRSFMDIPPDEWDRVMEVNVKGLWLCVKAVFPQMKEQMSGSIINIASTMVLKGGSHLLHYVSSKGAVVAFTRALAREVGDYGIRVNTIAPSHTLSEAVVRLGGPDVDKGTIPTRALKRSSYPEDMAGTLVYLSSQQSEFVTGQMLVVDGGSFMH